MYASTSLVCSALLEVLVEEHVLCVLAEGSYKWGRW